MPVFFIFQYSNMKKFNIALLISLIFSASAHADLLGLSNPADMAGKQGWGIYSAAHDLMATDYTSAKNFSGNWSGAFSPRNGTNLAIGMARAEAGITYDSWRLAGLYRREQVIEASRDMVDMVYYNKQHLAVPAGQTFNASLRIEGFEAKGLRLDKGFELAMNDNLDLSLGAGLSLLQGTRVRIANANGSATSTATGYTYNATMNDSNSRATYPYIVPGTPSGNGYALDLGAKLVWAKGARLDFTVNDLLGQMTWRNMPNTFETANSATLARDAAGYIYYNPLVSGVNDINRRTIVQKLSAKAHTRFTYPVSDFDLFAGTSWMMGYWFPEIGTAYRINENWKAQLSYDTRFKTAGLGIQNKWLNLTARSSSASIGNAQAYGFNAEVKLPF
jgi:hypothetical protein